MTCFDHCPLDKTALKRQDFFQALHDVMDIISYYYCQYFLISLVYFA